MGEIMTFAIIGFTAIIMLGDALMKKD